METKGTGDAIEFPWVPEITEEKKDVLRLPVKSKEGPLRSRRVAWVRGA